MERAAWLQRRYGATIEWLPFYLHPEYPPEGITREALEARYGERAINHVRRFIEESGLTYSPPLVVPNTMAALQLGEFARDAGLLEDVHMPLFKAFWAEGRDIGDVNVLGEIAEECGLDATGAVRAIRQRTYEDRVIGSTRAANEAGVSGVPAWVIDDSLLVPGAQPHEVFDRILSKLGYVPLEG